MSTQYPKRKRTEAADEVDTGRNRKQQKQFSKPPLRPGKNPDSKNAYTKGGRHKGVDRKTAEEEEEEEKSISALKGRIRDLTRSLRKADNDEKDRTPRGIRIERERELESCKHELEERQAAQRFAKFKSEMISKYHMVRFFERQKATRNLKRHQKQVAALEEGPEKAEKMPVIHDAEVDLNYTLYYPLLKAYVSLWPKQHRGGTKAEEGSQAAGGPRGPKGDVNIWRAVEKAMEEHTLEKLRESKEGVTVPGAPERSQAKAWEKAETKGKKMRPRESKSHDSDNNMRDEDENGSDDGFFA